MPQDPIKKSEQRAFLFLTIFLVPLLSIVTVGGFGFLIWLSQIIGGPPAG